MDETMAALLREPFPAEQIGKLPRVTCKDCRDAPGKVCSTHSKQRCETCGMYGTSAHIHLDFVGHAAATDRLLKADPQWTWEPMAFDSDGGPLIRTKGSTSSLWIRLTIGGVSRPGVGTAETKKDEADKELISDALRNAAMRFGVALDLWSKADLAEPDNGIEGTAPAPVYDIAATEDMDALKERVTGLEPNVAEQFAAWKNGQAFPWPWPAEAVEAMNRELDRLEMPPLSEIGEAPSPNGNPRTSGDGVETCESCGDKFTKTGRSVRSEKEPTRHALCESF